MSVKSRKTGNGTQYVGTLTQLSSGVVVNTNHYYSHFSGFERLISEGHPFHNRHLRRKGHDLGGVFGHQATYFESSPATVNLRGGIIASEFRYKGEIHAWSLTADFAESDLGALTPTPTMEGYGATGYNRAKPTASQMGLGQFIGELRDIPTLPKFIALRNAVSNYRHLSLSDLRNLGRSAGSGYLNYEFGWKPLLKDLKNFLQQTAKTDKILKQLSRDNMRWIHRGATIFNEESSATTFVNSQVGSPVMPSPLVLQSGRVARTTKVYRKIWFNGSFRYYIPTGNSPAEVEQRKRQLARIVYGAEASPKLVWELMRNSWLADWVANIGDNISNLSDNAADSLVSHYAYAMDHQVNSTDYTLQNCFLRGAGIVSPHARYVKEMKNRARAGPYGFALKPGNFSARQVAILGALGLTRL